VISPLASARLGLLLQPGEGEVLTLGLSRPTVKVGPSTGSHLLGILESDLPPGGGFPFPHWHENFEEAFYVLHGEIEYLLGGNWTTATAGTTIFIPPTAVHAFRNTSDQPARHLAIGTPAAMVNFIRDLGRATPDQFETVHELHRSHFVHDPPPLQI
jgi:quercetin dioxygenase-like cupin family protein